MSYFFNLIFISLSSFSFLFLSLSLSFRLSLLLLSFDCFYSFKYPLMLLFSFIILLLLLFKLVIAQQFIKSINIYLSIFDIYMYHCVMIHFLCIYCYFRLCCLMYTCSNPLPSTKYSIFYLNACCAAPSYCTLEKTVVQLHLHELNLLQLPVDCWVLIIFSPSYDSLSIFIFYFLLQTLLHLNNKKMNQFISTLSLARLKIYMHWEHNKESIVCNIG